MCFDIDLYIKPAVENPFSGTQLGNEHSVRFFRSVRDLPESCFTKNGAPRTSNIYLQKPFLTALEQEPPSGAAFAYLAFFDGRETVGFAVLQIGYFRAVDSLRITEKGFPAINYLKKLVARQIHFNTLICGSLALTGENAYWFDRSMFDDVREAEKILLQGIEAAKVALKRQGVQIQAILLKDFYNKRPFKVNGYNEFSVEPNMVMEIPADWKSAGDYLDALSSKYRVRAKRAFKKAEQIEKKEFNEERIIAYAAQIHALYLNIADGADFNLFHLSEGYFLSLQRLLKEDFTLHGYFLHGKLVAFYTTILNGETLEPHFLGYDPPVNQECQIYLNILFDVVGIAIEKKAKKISFARTAGEIKNSVGAEPLEMFLYLRSEHPLLNRLLPFALSFLKPRDAWTLRRPFK